MTDTKPFPAPEPGALVMLPGGSRGEVTRAENGEVVVRFPDGSTGHFATNLVTKQGATFVLDADAYAAASETIAFGETTESVIVPVVEETLRVGTIRRESGRVRVMKRTATTEEEVSVPLVSERVRVERVERDVVVDEAEGPRYEDDRTVIPVYAEEIVVTKRLVLREEIHLVKESETHAHTETVTLRRESVEIERNPVSEFGDET